MTTNRAEQAMWAQTLERALGNGYQICFDACESGLTYCYFNKQLYKKVPNDEMRGSINVTDYRFGFC